MYFFSFFFPSSYVSVFFSSSSFRKGRLFIWSLNSSFLVFPTPPWIYSIRPACVLTLTLSFTLVFSFLPVYLLLPFNLHVAWSSVLFTQVNLTALFCGSGISPLSFLKELVQTADFSVSGPPYSHLLPEGHSKMQI